MDAADRVRTILEIDKEAMHFAAAHFTLFSAEERENLHGHNFRVALEVEAGLGEGGIAFDYNCIKTALKSLCDRLDEHVLLPSRSPWLQVTTDGDYLVACFNGERIPFLKRDVLLLPVANITVEALAAWILAELQEDTRISALGLGSLAVRVSSGPGAWARAEA